MAYDSHIKSINHFYNLRSGKGILITIPFFDEPDKDWVSIDDFEELNAGINERNIFIAPDPVGGYGGAGIPELMLDIPPETIQVIQIIIRDIAIGIFSSFAYDTFKEAIKKIIKTYQEKKGVQKEINCDISHYGKSVSFIIINGELDAKILDSSLRTLLSDVVLRADRDFPTDSDQGVG